LADAYTRSRGFTGCGKYLISPEKAIEIMPRGPTFDGLVTRSVAGYRYGSNWVIFHPDFHPLEWQLASLHAKADPFERVPPCLAKCMLAVEGGPAEAVQQ
jgi:hypothetical protein